MNSPPLTESAPAGRHQTEAKNRGNRQTEVTASAAVGKAIDYYPTARAARPTNETTLPDFIEAIRSDEFAGVISKLREMLASKDEDGYAEAKRNLPAVSISGTVKGRRAKAHEEGRFTHSGYLQIDLDGKDNVGWTVEEMRDMLRAIPWIVGGFTSASGEGIKGVARIPASVETHLDAFLAAEAYLKELKLTVDPACKDPGRLCFVSHDPDAWIDLDRTAVCQPAPTHAADEIDEGIKLRLRNSAFPAPPTNGIHAWLMVAAWHCRFHGMSEPETVNKLKSFDGTLRRRLQPTEAEDAARKVFAQPLQDATPPTPPEKIFPVPAGGISYAQAGSVIFPVIAEAQNMFLRGGKVVEIVAADGAHHLEPVTGRRFASQVERYGHRVAKREVDSKGVERWRTATLAQNHADVLLESEEARTLLPPITQMVRCEILSPTGDVLARGYHDHAGGTYITRGRGVPNVPLDDAAIALLEILMDFNFSSEADGSRAVAHLLSPAMKMGGFITGDFPLDLSEADQSQSGKTYRQKITAAIYDESPVSVSQPKGGVGSLDEAVATALLKGRPFINLDNYRGRLDSTTLEQALRGVGRVHCRGFRKEGVVDCRPFIWQLSTNGAELTRDLANRSIVTRIRKQPDGFTFRQYPEGDLEAHIRGSGGYYLGCVFAVIRAWLDAGRPATDEHRHDFREWVRPLDWIVQNVFTLPPLLDGHREEQERTANPALQWLRDVCHAAHHAGMTNRQLLTSEIVSIAEDAGINFPGNPASREEPQQRAGKILALLFRTTKGEPVTTDGFKVHRETFTHYGKHGPEERKQYLIEK